MLGSSSSCEECFSPVSRIDLAIPNRRPAKNLGFVFSKVAATKKIKGLRFFGSDAFSRLSEPASVPGSFHSLPAPHCDAANSIPTLVTSF